MWEDERNRHGGRWLVNTQKNFRQQELDRLWVETVRSLIFLPSICQLSASYTHLLYFKNHFLVFKMCPSMCRVTYINIIANLYAVIHDGTQR